MNEMCITLPSSSPKLGFFFLTQIFSSIIPGSLLICSSYCYLTPTISFPTCEIVSCHNPPFTKRRYHVKAQLSTIKPPGINYKPRMVSPRALSVKPANPTLSRPLRNICSYWHFFPVPYTLNYLSTQQTRTYGTSNLVAVIRRRDG